MVTLSNVMRANAVSCIGFGAIFYSFPLEVSHFLSMELKAPELLIVVLGVGLFMHGLHLLWASFKLLPSKYLILYFSIGDYIWVLSTSVLVILGIWITTPKGILSTLLVAVMVGTLGVLQMLKRKAMGEIVDGNLL